MGIVTAKLLYNVHGDAPATNKEARQHGLVFLGENLLNELNLGPGAKPRDFAIALTTAMHTTLTATVDPGKPNEGENRAKLFYEFDDDGNPTTPPARHRIMNVTRFRRTVICELEGHPKPLALNVKMDRRDDDALEMDVIFPDELDGTDFGYLETAAKDIVDIDKDLGSGDPGKNYAAAFKFLSRCK